MGNRIGKNNERNKEQKAWNKKRADILKEAGWKRNSDRWIRPGVLTKNFLYLLNLSEAWRIYKKEEPLYYLKKLVKEVERETYE